jgi:hypothetical protein
MTSLLILVKDNINNTYSIYDNKTDSGFKECIEFLEKKTLFQFKNVIIDDKLCELFVEKKNTQKGWIWNTDVTDAIKMYTLSFINMLNKSEKMDDFTQTEKEEMVDKNVQITPIPIITKNTTSQTTQNLHTNLSYSPINYFEYEIDENIYKNKVTPCVPKVIIKEETKVPLSIEGKICNRDYSLNDRLITELKQHLTTTNYGLRRRKKRYD